MFKLTSGLDHTRGARSTDHDVHGPPKRRWVRQCDESDAGHSPCEVCIVIDPSAGMA